MFSPVPTSTCLSLLVHLCLLVTFASVTRAGVRGALFLQGASQSRRNCTRKNVCLRSPVNRSVCPFTPEVSLEAERSPQRSVGATRRTPERIRRASATRWRGERTCACACACACACILHTGMHMHRGYQPVLWSPVMPDNLQPALSYRKVVFYL